MGCVGVVWGDKRCRLVCLLINVVCRVRPGSFDAQKTAMTTIPSRLAQVARMSSSSEEARRRVIDLYRAWIRAVSLESLVRERLLTTGNARRHPKSSPCTLSPSPQHTSDTAYAKSLRQTGMLRIHARLRCSYIRIAKTFRRLSTVGSRPTM